MSYLYRPTPVVTLGAMGGRHPSAYKNNGRHPGAVMQGVAVGRNYKQYFDGMRRTVSGAPWIHRSGTMNGFLAGGLGDDSLDPNATVYATYPADLSYNADPTISDLPLSTDPGMYLDPSMAAPFSLAMPAPITSDAMLSAPMAAPNIVSAGGSLLNPANLFGAEPTPSVMNVIPPAAQNMNTAAVATGIGGALSSIGTAIKSFFTPTPSLPAGYSGVALPGSAGLLTPAAGASWFSQASPLSPTMSNGTMLMIGGAALVAVLVLAGGGKK